MEPRTKRLIILGTLLAILAVISVVKFVKAGSFFRTDDIERIRELARNSTKRPRAILGGLNSADPDVRRETLILLRQYRNPADEGEILAMTYDEDPRVRAAAGKTLGGYDTQAAVERLREMALAEKEASVREDAITGLAINDHPLAVVTLSEMVDGTLETQDTEYVATSIVRKFKMARTPDFDDPREMLEFSTGLKKNLDVQHAYAETNVTLVIDQAVWDEMDSRHAAACHNED
jgi:hypothetical protein